MQTGFITSDRLSVATPEIQHFQCFHFVRERGIMHFFSANQAKEKYAFLSTSNYEASN